MITNAAYSNVSWRYKYILTHPFEDNFPCGAESSTVEMWNHFSTRPQPKNLLYFEKSIGRNHFSSSNQLFPRKICW